MKIAKLVALLWVGACAFLSRANAEPAPLSSQQIFKKWAGAVVTVETQTKTGTGFFDNSGLLFTAYHVLDGANSATITFPSGQKARITGAIVADKAKDYALLMADSRLNGPKLADYAALQPGEHVTVIGSPRGLAQTITEGIVSAKRQDNDRQLLQLSASISPGSSGSPVFNTRGEVVGLVVETLEGGQALNFAVSSADLKSHLGVPLAQAFSDGASAAGPASPETQAPAPAGGFGSVLCHECDPRMMELVRRGASGYVGLKDVEVSAADVPEALADKVSKDDLRQWVADALTVGGVKVVTAGEHKASSGAEHASQTDMDYLRWSDSFGGRIYVALAAVRSEDGSVSLSYHLAVDRAGIIMPGWIDMVAVDSEDGVECLGAARNMHEDVHRAVTEAAAQIVSRYQYANRPSHTSASSDGQ